MQKEAPVIIGNALAAMVAALHMANAGQQVSFINPGGPLGGYFAGLDIDGHLFDNGLVLFELDGYMTQTSELATYDPKVRNDVGRFLHVVHAWASSHGGLHQISMPQMLYRQQWYDDVLSSNAYHAFSHLPFAKDAVSDFHSSLTVDFHAREKAQGEIYEYLDFQTASVANHGLTMHNAIIEPYMMKTLGVHSGSVLARYHRIGWLPLYYPETLAACFRGETVPLKPTNFHYPKHGSVASLCAKMQSEVVNHPNIHYFQSPIHGLKKVVGQWQVMLNGNTLSTKQLNWSGAPAALMGLLGLQASISLETKAPIAVLFLRIPTNQVYKLFSILQIPDLEYSAYRVTNQSVCAGEETEAMNLTVELNLNYCKILYGEHASDDVLITKVLQELTNLGVLSVDTKPYIAELKRIPGGFLVPTKAARDAWLDDYECIVSTYPDIHLMAMSSGFFVTSLNDQVIQGLYYAEKQLSIGAKT
jgi:hypothetical protein